jgi:hypothetical protein
MKLARYRIDAWIDTPRLSPASSIGCSAKGWARVRPGASAGNALHVGIIALQREVRAPRSHQSAEP